MLIYSRDDDGPGWDFPETIKGKPAKFVCPLRQSCYFTQYIYTNKFRMRRKKSSPNLPLQHLHQWQQPQSPQGVPTPMLLVLSLLLSLLPLPLLLPLPPHLLLLPLMVRLSPLQMVIILCFVLVWFRVYYLKKVVFKILYHLLICLQQLHLLPQHPMVLLLVPSRMFLLYSLSLYTSLKAVF